MSGVTRVSRPLIMVLVVAAVLRLAAALYLGNSVSGLSGAFDEISYSELGWRVVTGDGLTFEHDNYPWIPAGAPQSYYSASMSLYLAAIYAVFGHAPLAARLITGVLGVVAVALTYALGVRFFGDRTALIGAALAAIYPYFVFYNVTLVTETPFIVAVLAALVLADRIRAQPSGRDWLLLSVCLAVATLFRMAVVFFVPVLLGWIVVERRGEWRKAVLAVVVIGCAVAPFTYRNYRLWDRFLLLESQFGHVFWNGNHPGHQGDFHPTKVFQIPRAVLASGNDAIITNTLLRMGLANVRADPVHFARLTVTRLREFFTFWPTSDSDTMANALRVLSFGWLAPLSAVGLAVCARRWRDLMPLYLFMFIHTGIYAVSWTMIRYRMPLDAVLVLFGAVVVERIVGRWRAVPAEGSRAAA